MTAGAAQNGTVLGVLQARCSSSRLPGKVLLPLQGEPMLMRQIERVRRAQSIDRLTVATSTSASDGPLAELCRSRNIDCFRGSLEDVLDRVYRAAERVNPAYVVRLTGDCPLADPAVIDAVVRFCMQGGFDYASNALEPTFPDGLDVEVMTFASLREAWTKARLHSEREHVTPYIYKHDSEFRIGSYKREPDLSALRWTVDEPQDYELVCTIYDALYPSNPSFSTEDVLRLMDARPHMKTSNTRVARNEGYAKSLERDQAPTDDTMR
jgi:spore coat polysaccharide biosynthesis protein SpsF